MSGWQSINATTCDAATRLMSPSRPFPSLPSSSSSQSYRVDTNKQTKHTSRAIRRRRRKIQISERCFQFSITNPSIQRTANRIVWRMSTNQTKLRAKKELTSSSHNLSSKKSPIFVAFSSSSPSPSSSNSNPNSDDRNSSFRVGRRRTDRETPAKTGQFTVSQLQTNRQCVLIE